MISSGPAILGHGVDLVENARIARLLDDHGERFAERVFTESERAYADAGDRRRVERYAARFAAKEAAFKALGTGWRSGLSWQDIEVERNPLGQPTLVLRGGCAGRAASMGVTGWLVSLSHTDTHAIASVIATGDPAARIA